MASRRASTFREPSNQEIPLRRSRRLLPVETRNSSASELTGRLRTLAPQVSRVRPLSSLNAIFSNQGQSATTSVLPVTRQKKTADKAVQTTLQEETNSDTFHTEINRKRSRDDYELPCSICLDNMHPSNGLSLQSLPCGHIYCKPCVENCVASNIRLCPLCNKKYKISDIKPAYI